METGDPLLKSTVLPLSPCARSCALSPDGSVVAAGFDDGSLKVEEKINSIVDMYFDQHCIHPCIIYKRLCIFMPNRYGVCQQWKQARR